MIRILLLTLSLLFTQELEVQGDLKVSGSIDAQNNPVKNVGTPIDMNDAVNAQILQDALRDEGPYEYISYKTYVNHTSGNGSMYWAAIGSSNITDQWLPNFMEELNIKSLEGYEITHVIQLPYGYDPQTGSSGIGTITGGDSYLLIILKRPIEE